MEIKSPSLKMLAEVDKGIGWITFNNQTTQCHVNGDVAGLGRYTEAISGR